VVSVKYRITPEQKTSGVLRFRVRSETVCKHKDLIHVARYTASREGCFYSVLYGIENKKKERTVTGAYPKNRTHASPKAVLTLVTSTMDSIMLMTHVSIPELTVADVSLQHAAASATTQSTHQLVRHEVHCFAKFLFE
jgi:hypothetical protein